jgi:hypothetical protein
MRLILHIMDQEKCELKELLDAFQNYENLLE